MNCCKRGHLCHRPIKTNKQSNRASLAHIMPSVRDRVGAFEAKGKKGNDDSPEESGEGPRKRECACERVCQERNRWSRKTCGHCSSHTLITCPLSSLVPAGRGQRFLFPGSSKAGKQDGGSNHALEQWTRPSSGSSRSPTGFEAGLEEVWSVRKNIGVGMGRSQDGRGHGARGGGGMVTALSTYGAKAPSQHGLYSRHSAMSMAAQPASQGRAVGAARSTSECVLCSTAHVSCVSA